MNSTLPKKIVAKYRPTLSAAGLQLVYALVVTKLNTLTSTDEEYAVTKDTYLNIGRMMLTAQIMPERAAYTPKTDRGSSNNAFSVADSLGLGLEELSDMDKLNAMSEEEKAVFNAQLMADITGSSKK